MLEPVAALVFFLHREHGGENQQWSGQEGGGGRQDELGHSKEKDSKRKSFS